MSVGATKNYENLPLIDALASATGNFIGALNGPAISTTSLDMQPGAIVNNIKDAGEKLDTIGRLREMAVNALEQAPSSAPLNSPQGVRQMVVDNLLKLGIAASVAAAVPAAGAAAGAAMTVAAGIDQGPSSFKVSNSGEGGKSKSAMPDEGWQPTSPSPTHAGLPPMQARYPNIPPAQLQQEQETVNRVVASRDRQGVIQELGSVSVAEQSLSMQIKAARDLALKSFGIDSPDVLVQRGGPDMELAQSAGPQQQLGIAPPKVAKPFAGIFG